MRSKFKAPFRVTLRGAIFDLSEMLLSQHAASKRTLNLGDDAGMSIRCCALGLSARSRALENGNEVVLYYGTGRSGIGSSPGMVYFMKDSLIVQVGHRAVVAIKTAEISVDAQDC